MQYPTTLTYRLPEGETVSVSCRGIDGALKLAASLRNPDFWRVTLDTENGHVYREWTAEDGVTIFDGKLAISPLSKK